MQYNQQQMDGDNQEGESIHDIKSEEMIIEEQSQADGGRHQQHLDNAPPDMAGGEQAVDSEEQDDEEMIDLTPEQ